MDIFCEIADNVKNGYYINKSDFEEMLKYYDNMSDKCKYVLDTLMYDKKLVDLTDDDIDKLNTSNREKLITGLNVLSLYSRIIAEIHRL